jgi:DHA1 family multidrug resistance protein-like MFS transporter
MLEVIRHFKMDLHKGRLSQLSAKPKNTKTFTLIEDITLDAQGFVEFGPDDLDNPKNWSKARRWWITLVAVLLVINSTFASSAPSATVRDIAEGLQVSPRVAGLVTTCYLLGYCAGPLFWAPLSEFYGRRWIFYCTFALYAVSTLICAFAPNFPVLLTGRFITGVFASSALSNSPGFLADIWGPIERGNAMALFSTMTFMGPSLGPVIVGFLELEMNWRWCFYVLLWLAFPSLVLMLTISETLPEIILLKKAQRIRELQWAECESVKAPVEADSRSLSASLTIAMTRPWRLLVDPISLLVAIYLSVVYCLLYMLFTIYPIVFQEERGWNSGVGQLPLIGTIIGAVLGGAIVYAMSFSDAKRAIAGHEAVPEDRLPAAMIDGIIFPIAMLLFAWTGEYNHIHWMVPSIAGCCLATSILLIFVAYLNYITDTYLMYAASALAANTVTRAAAGAASPLFTRTMFTKLGVGVGGSIVGCIACLLAPIPFVFYKYGSRIRGRSRFASARPT